MNYDKIRRYADLVVVIIGASLLSYLFLKHVFIYVLPFLIGWFIAFAIRPIAAFLSERLRIKEAVLRLVLTILIYALLIGVMTLVIWLLSREIWLLLARLGEENGSLEQIISGIVGSGGIVGRIFGDFSDYIADALYRVAISMLSSVGSALSLIISAVPKALFFMLVSIIASAYFAISLEQVNSTVKRLLPKQTFDLLVKLKDGFLGVFLKYLRSYLCILFITFSEMLIGLFLIKAPYPLIMAILIALLDLLPVIGVGSVLIPWGVWAFIVGRTPFGIGLLLLFVVHTVLRQIIEPRIVGKNLGIHPLLTLVFIYVGYSIFGFIGILLVPILTVLVNVAFRKNDSSEVA